MRLLAFAVLVISAFSASDAFCWRLYDFPLWRWKSLSQRAADADIVVYGTVTDSPCEKPPVISIPQVYQNSTAQAPVSSNATNSSSSEQKPSPTPQVNVQETNTTDICFQRVFYNVTLKVLCVIKGGFVPKTLHLRQFGFGRDMCVDYRYNETFYAFHVYQGLNYLVFLGRDRKATHSFGFWPHQTNKQPAATEIPDESMLTPVFETAGGHARVPHGTLANETHGICKPYVGGVETIHGALIPLFLSLLCGILLI